jgi:hypothetical protein
MLIVETIARIRREHFVKGKANLQKPVTSRYGKGGAIFTPRRSSLRSTSTPRRLVGLALICVVAVTVEALSLRKARIR